MTGINMARVLVGGVVAGLVINIGEFVLNMFVLEAEMDVLGLGVLIAGESGIGTALCAGATVWFFAYLYPSVGMVVMGMFPAGTTAIALVWGLVEVLAGAAVGAWLYQEQASGVHARV